MNTATVNIGKIFTTGRSQAVRLPKAFRFSSKEVTIERQGDALILRPLQDAATWAQSLKDALDAFDPDFKIERAEEWPQADRESLKF